MTSTIITKNSATAGLAPSAGQLVQGELAVNVTDKKIYTLNSTGGVVLLSSGSDYDIPIVIDVNSSSEGLTVNQAGSGGSAVFTNSGAGDTVRITNTGAGNSFVVEDITNPDSTPFVIDTTGYVLVGFPSVIGGARLQINGGDSRYRFSSSPTNGSFLNLFRSKSGTDGVNSPVALNDQIGNVNYLGADGTGYVSSSGIATEVDGAVSTNIVPGRLLFSTANSSGTLTERLRLTSTGALAINGASNYGASGQALISAGNAAPVWTDQFLTITYIFSGGGNVLTAGDQGDLTIPFACTITEWTMLADVSGSAVIDIWKDTYANYPPTVADTITGSAKPTISTATKGQSSTLTGWTTTIAAGDTLRFNVDSATTVSRVTLSLKVKRT